jgi:hypothetical protein
MHLVQEKERKALEKMEEEEKRKREEEEEEARKNAEQEQEEGDEEIDELDIDEIMNELEEEGPSKRKALKALQAQASQDQAQTRAKTGPAPPPVSSQASTDIDIDRDDEVSASQETITSACDGSERIKKVPAAAKPVRPSLSFEVKPLEPPATNDALGWRKYVIWERLQKPEKAFGSDGGDVRTPSPKKKGRKAKKSEDDEDDEEEDGEEVDELDE